MIKCKMVSLLITGHEDGQTQRSHLGVSVNEKMLGIFPLSFFYINFFG